MYNSRKSWITLAYKKETGCKEPFEINIGNKVVSENWS